jgi:hypothetical protein
MRLLGLLGEIAAWLAIGAVMLIVAAMVVLVAPLFLIGRMAHWIMARWRSWAEPTRIALEIGPETEALKGKAVGMANVSVGVGRQRVVRARFVRGGVERPIDGPPRFEIDNEAIARFRPVLDANGQADPFRRRLVGVSAGQVAGRIIGDARQGAEVRELVTQLAITVPDPEATEIEVEIGEEEDDTQE